MYKRVFRSLGALLAATVFVYCLLNSGEIAEGCGKYLALCGRRVVPSLFVFSVLAAIICKSSLFYRVCGLCTGSTEAALLIMGTLGGFPLGATVAYELYDNGKITKRQGEYLCAFSNTPSISFTISYVGGVLGSRNTGIVLACLCLLSSSLCALVLRYAFLKKSERNITFSSLATPKTNLAVAIKDCSYTMLTICGCVVFFGSLCLILPPWLSGFLELSGGISVCKSPVEAAILLGFSGISVMCQVAAVCKGKLSVLPFLLSKLMQSAIMGLTAYFLFDFNA